MFMGQIPDIYGGPADAVRALPGFRYALIPYGDAMRPSDPRRLRAHGAAHVAAVLRALQGLARSMYGLATPAASRGRAQPLGAPFVARRAAPWCWKRVFVVDHLSLIALRGRPLLLSRSPAAALDRLRCAPPAWARASGQGCGISSAATRPPVILAPAFGFPAVTRPCSAPKPRWRPFGGAPCAAIYEAAPKSRYIKERRTSMITKTTSTTKGAGPSPAPREAHQRSGGEGSNQDTVRMLLNDDKAFGRAMARLIAYVRRHAVAAGN